RARGGARRDRRRRRGPRRLERRRLCPPPLHHEEAGMIPPPPPPIEQHVIPPATPLTIEDVRRDPRRWDGKWVRIEGWINRCWRTDCMLAERLAARPINEGMSLSFEAQDSFDVWVKPML